MLKNRSKLSSYLLVLSALISPFLFFSSDLKPWGPGSQPGVYVQHLIQPFELLWTRAINTTSSLWNRYIYLVEVEKENKLLRDSLSRLQGRVMDYEHQVNEVTRLRKLLGFSSNYKKDVLIGEIIATGENTFFPTLRVNRGRIHDIKAGMPVLAASGIIGRVLRTGLNFCDVQLTNDPNFSVDVAVERTRVRGVVSGAKGNKLRLELKRKMDVKIGDTVITSGIVGGFPKGLPVGRVTKVSYETNQLSQIVMIEPWADYRKLEEVLIIKNDDKFMNIILETAGSSWLEKAKHGG